MSAVKEQIMQVVNSGVVEWLEPEEIIKIEEEEDYPLDSLPEIIKDAVIEVADAVQCPIPLVACTALAVASIATQALGNVVVNKQFQFPISLWFMVVAESGERKTHSEKKFKAAIKLWEKSVRTQFEQAIRNYKTQLEIWSSERDGLIAKIKDNTRRNQDNYETKNKLIELNNSKPVEPVIPKALVGDATPEALGYELATGWRSRGILSSEGATILGSHGMGKDSVLRNMASYNTYWDGEGQEIHRRTSEN